VRNALCRIERDALSRPAANDEFSVELLDAAESEKAAGRVELIPCAPGEAGRMGMRLMS
jgi:hypothetical protein